jgi:K+-sensing histidine kinase KdpD
MSEESELTDSRKDLGTGQNPQIDPAKMTLLYNASRALASTTSLDHLLAVISNEVQRVLYCEGVGVVLYDPERDDFYWRSVHDKDSLLSSAKEEIRIPKDKGVGGWVFETGSPALVHDAANDPRLFRQVETKSGFSTRNMICVPLETAETRLGVLYALNKTNGSFTEEDVEILMALGGNVALALENATFYHKLKKAYEEVSRLNHVKNKMLHHLSHELKTPLAVMEASLGILRKKLGKTAVEIDQRPFDRVGRNLERLKTIEKQVSHIVEERDYGEGRIMADFLENLRDFAEVQQEEVPELASAIELLKKKIFETFPSEQGHAGSISTHAVFSAAEFRVRRMSAERDLDILFEEPDHAIFKIQPQILMSALGGLIRNAVENTPDQGKVVISGKLLDNGYRISVKDYGVGVPDSEKVNIFEGFYHLQETDMYSSGRRYAFNAGGTGADLLKIKIFAQRFGFEVGFDSVRCSCIPRAGDTCPGRVDQCESCSGIDDCLENGGSEFWINIPQGLLGSAEMD